MKKIFFCSLILFNSLVHALSIIPVPEPPTDVAPICEAGADPQSIRPGKGTALWWWSDAVASASIDNGIGSVTVPSDYKWIHPSETTTYTMTVTGEDGTTTTCETTITVDEQAEPNAPICEMGADPQVINAGEGAALWWWSDNVASASIDNEIRSITVPSDYIWLTPTQTTTYTMNAVGENGENTECETTITVESDNEIDEEFINAFINDAHSNFANVMDITYSVDKAVAFAHVNLRGIEKIFVYSLIDPRNPVNEYDIPYGTDFYFKEFTSTEVGLVSFVLVEVEPLTRENEFIRRLPTGVEYAVIYNYINKAEISKTLLSADNTPEAPFTPPEAPQ